MDEHDVFGRFVTYYWDFDTDETDTYGHLYSQTYRYVPGDTAREVGQVPMVTKTFLCDVGTCDYTIAMRAQDGFGNFGDTTQEITVNAESTQWRVANTICVSNSLNINDDWTGFDKPCPNGALKQANIPLPDGFDGKLVLLRRGDTFVQKFYVQIGQSNFKVGAFGNALDAKPNIAGDADNQNFGAFELDVADYSATGDVVDSADTTITDADVAKYGWSKNITFEGLRLAMFAFPESFEQIGIHDIDMDMEQVDYRGGIVRFTGGVRCTDYPDFLDCKNVPFPNGAYVSSVNVVGSPTAEINQISLNVAGIGCSMVNNTGIVNSQFRKAGEHNLRVMGWYRFNIMRSYFRGEHYARSKQKITTRPCAEGDLADGSWATNSEVPDTWNDDIEGRTRADTYLYNGTDQYVHESRYLVINGNVIGEKNTLGAELGGPKYQTNVTAGNEALTTDIIVTRNTFIEEDGARTSDISSRGNYLTCVDNVYSDVLGGCYPSSLPEWNMLRDPTPLDDPEAPTTSN